MKRGVTLDEGIHEHIYGWRMWGSSGDWNPYSGAHFTNVD